MALRNLTVSRTPRRISMYGKTLNFAVVLVNGQVVTSADHNHLVGPCIYIPQANAYSREVATECLTGDFSSCSHCVPMCVLETSQLKRLEGRIGCKAKS